jgi:hypothetical protein
MKDMYIISPNRVGSTLLTNIFYGLLKPDAPVEYISSLPIDSKREDGNIFKTHHLPCFDLENVYKIGIERNGIAMIDEKYKKEDVLVFQYEDILYKSAYVTASRRSLYDMISSIAERVTIKFKIALTPEQVDQSCDRVMDMDSRYGEIKDMPFAYLDRFYHIHGQHRGRGDASINS